MSTTDAERLQ